MTRSRDPERLIHAFVEEGPTVVADRVLDAIWADVEATDQRAGFLGPWRTLPMIRPILATAAIVAVIAAGLALYSMVRPNVGIEPFEPTPAPSPAAFPGATRTELAVGTTYLLDDFREPLQLTIPESWADGGIVRGDGNSLGFRVDAFDWGVATFHDDESVVDDLCAPTTGIDLPSTVDGVDQWLAGSPGLTVSEPTQFTIDGRPASAWDVTLGESCVLGSEPPVDGVAFWFQRGEHHRLYAIDTGDDVVLGATWGADFAGAGEEFLDEMNAATDDLVQTFDFQ